MTQTTKQAVRTLLVGVIAVLGLLGFSASGLAETATPAVPAPAAQQALSQQAPAQQPACGDTSGFDKVNLSALPKEATDTVNLIKQGGPYPYPQDGTVFHNREGILPGCDDGYYHEYTVQTPGSDDRGARRIVTGEGGEYFYTGDHYDSFQLVNINA